MWILTPPSERFFKDPQQRKQVEALFSVIVPGDTLGPSATDVDAVEYLDRLLAMDEKTYYEIPAWKDLYTKALPALDQASAAINNGATITQLSKDKLVDLLDRLSKGQLSGFPAGLDQKVFFETLRNHCIEGCFADPRWGGNKDGKMWRWFGYLQDAEETMWRYTG
jgi:gluconate 2-dehydrogenase gamma chain